MTGPFSISGDDEERTLRDYVEWFALGLAYNAVNGEKSEPLLKMMNLCFVWLMYAKHWNLNR